MANYDGIYIGNVDDPIFHFTESEILMGNIYVANSPISDTLEEDVFEFDVLSDAVGNRRIFTKFLEQYKTRSGQGYVVAEKNILELAYSTPVFYYANGKLQGKFFLTSVEQISERAFNIKTVSTIGLLSYVVHYGGIYGVDGTITVAQLIRDIVGNFEFEIDPIFESMLIQGYLPKASARENLQQVLFAIGAAVLKADNGNPVITFNEPETAKELNSENVYVGGALNRGSKATKITLTEHQYFKGANTQPEDVFNNLDDIITVNHQEIVFNDPVYDLHAYAANGVDITSQFIIESGVNYAVIGTEEVGRARVTGKKYQHQQRQIVRNVNPQAIEQREVNVSNATLVSPLNSTNCISRVVAYYSEANEVSLDFTHTDEKAGELIQFPYMYNTVDRVLGYIKNLDINISAVNKATSKVATDWRPNHLGNTYNRYLIIDKNTLGGLNGTWTVPAALRGKEVYAVMFSGASGGYGGQNGADGGSAGYGGSTGYYNYSKNDTSDAYSPYPTGTAGRGGVGGAGGLGGSGCKRYGSSIFTLSANSYSVSLGAGGAGGAIGSKGQDGGHTLFGSFSSNENDLAGVYVNFVDNSVYCRQGEAGIDGGNGGDGGSASSYDIVPAYANDGVIGRAVNGFYGGKPTAGGILQQHNADSTKFWYLNVGGGGGGGASANASGQDATAIGGAVTGWWARGGGAYVWIMYSRTGGSGGDGASAIKPLQETEYGRGGKGANGGAGGGGAGATASSPNRPSGTDFDLAAMPKGGKGGKSTEGGQGADGFVLIYYTEEA